METPESIRHKLDAAISANMNAGKTINGSPVLADVPFVPASESPDSPDAEAAFVITLNEASADPSSKSAFTV